MKKPYDIIVEHGIIEDIDFLVRKDVVSAIIEAMEEYAASREIVDVLPIHSSGEDEICCEWFSCPKCNEQYTIKALDNYCPICGVKLNWKL